MTYLYDINDFDCPWYLIHENIDKTIEISNGRDATAILLDSCIDTNHIALNDNVINECNAYDYYNINELQYNYEYFIKRAMQFSVDSSLLLCTIDDDVFELNTRTKQLYGIPEYLSNKIIATVKQGYNHIELTNKEKGQILISIVNKCSSNCQSKLQETFQSLKDDQVTIPLLTNITQKLQVEDEFNKKLHRYSHGTSMSGLLVASKCILPKDEFSKLSEQNISVMGIAPEAKIFGIEGTSINSFEKMFKENVQIQINLLDVFKEHKTTSNLLINISGGEINSRSQLKQWVDVIKSKGSVASVIDS